jgi:hypothetical protein
MFFVLSAVFKRFSTILHMLYISFAVVEHMS